MRCEHAIHMKKGLPLFENTYSYFPIVFRMIPNNSLELLKSNSNYEDSLNKSEFN